MNVTLIFCCGNSFFDNIFNGCKISQEIIYKIEPTMEIFYVTLSSFGVAAAHFGFLLQCKRTLKHDMERFCFANKRHKSNF